MSGEWKTSPDDNAKLVELWAADHPGVEPPTVWRHANGLTAIVGREPLDTAGRDLRWHVSVRYGDRGVNGRVPTWGELVQAAHELRPGVVFVVGVPPRSWWVNVHPDVLHLYETRDEALVAQWRAEQRGHEPT
jgi:hypothetical protein